MRISPLMMTRPHISIGLAAVLGTALLLAPALAWYQSHGGPGGSLGSGGSGNNSPALNRPRAKPAAGHLRNSQARSNASKNYRSQASPIPDHAAQPNSGQRSESSTNSGNDDRANPSHVTPAGNAYAQPPQSNGSRAGGAQNGNSSPGTGNGSNGNSQPSTTAQLPTPQSSPTAQADSSATAH
jgi:hypothetical protein